MRRFCGHNEPAPAGLSERSLEIRAGEDCARCCQAAVERDIAAGRRDADGYPVVSDPRVWLEAAK